MKTLIALLLTITIAAAAGTAAFLGLQYLDLQKQVAQHNAVQGCMEISSFTSNQVENGIVIVEPVVTAYTKCLELKGIALSE
jgi:hypothetical protein